MGTVAIVLLAAGTSQRFGSLKQLEVLEGRSLVRRAVETAVATGLPVFVVTGSQADRVEAELDGLAVTCLRNVDWARGMGGSLSLGASIAGPNASALMVMLADQPLVTVEDLRALLDVHAAESEAIVAAEYGDGVIGPPCLFPRRDFAALVRLKGDRGARGVLREQADRVKRVSMPNAAIDIDTPGDWARVTARVR